MENYMLRSILALEMLFKFMVRKYLTSSNVLSHAVRELRRTPIRNGAGASITSVISNGKMGTKVCCQEKGYNSDSSASTQRDNVL